MVKPPTTTTTPAADRLDSDTKLAIEECVRKRELEIDEVNHRRVLRYTAVAGLFSLALVAALGWALSEFLEGVKTKAEHAAETAYDGRVARAVLEDPAFGKLIGENTIKYVMVGNQEKCPNGWLKELGKIWAVHDDNDPAAKDEFINTPFEKSGNVPQTDKHPFLGLKVCQKS